MMSLPPQRFVIENRLTKPIIGIVQFITKPKTILTIYFGSRQGLPRNHGHLLLFIDFDVEIPITKDSDYIFKGRHIIEILPNPKPLSLSIVTRTVEEELMEFDKRIKMDIQTKGMMNVDKLDLNPMHKDVENLVRKSIEDISN